MDPVLSRCCNCICNDAVQRKIKCVLLSISACFHNNILCYDVPLLEINDTFTKELIETWLYLNFKKQPSDFFGLPIWSNCHVRIDKKSIFDRN